MASTARLTCTEGGASKFWEGWVEGKTFFVRFGKIGSEGQTRSKKLASPAAAAAELAKVTAEKRRKGYVAGKAREMGKGKGADGIRGLWERLEAYAAAKGVSLELRPGTTEKKIRAAERTMKMTFPADFRASLLVHDGQEPGDGSEDAIECLPGHNRLASLDRIVAQWKYECECFEKYCKDEESAEIEQGRLLGFLWHPRRIPIAGNPWFDQDNTLLDLTPGSRGVPGQVVKFGKGCFGRWCGASFGEELAAHVDGLGKKRRPRARAR